MVHGGFPLLDEGSVVAVDGVDMGGRLVHCASGCDLTRSKVWGQSEMMRGKSGF